MTDPKDVEVLTEERTISEVWVPPGREFGTQPSRRCVAPDNGEEFVTHRAQFVTLDFGGMVCLDCCASIFYGRGEG